MIPFARIKLSSVLSSVALAKVGEVAGGPDGTFVNRIADVIVYLLFDQDMGGRLSPLRIMSMKNVQRRDLRPI